MDGGWIWATKNFHVAQTASKPQRPAKIFHPQTGEVNPMGGGAQTPKAATGY